MFSNVEALTKSERKIKKQLKKAKKRQEKLDKSIQVPGRCHFFVTHKKRYCRMNVVPKKRYCSQHLVMDHVPDDDGHVRIPCPLDPKHSVYQHMLVQHLTVCNARAPTHLPYYCADRNCGPLHDDEDDKGIDIRAIRTAPNTNCALTQDSSEKLSCQKQCVINDGDQDHLSLNGRAIADLTDEELLTLIKRVIIAEKDHTEAICKEELLHPSMQDQLENNDSSVGPSIRKHLLQNASLVAHLEAAGAFIGYSKQNSEEKMACAEELVERRDEEFSIKRSGNFHNEDSSVSCFLEFGAGKGQLSHRVANASSCSHPLQTVLIDRGAQRYRFDTRINEAAHVSAVRLRVDIADLALERVEGVLLTGRVFAGGKHLCGAATDLTVRCLQRSGVLPASSGQRGLVIALCCHNRCSWQHYTGKSFLKRLGFGGSNFPALLGLSSWAVCEAQPPVGTAGARKQGDRRSAPGPTTLVASTTIGDAKTAPRSDADSVMDATSSSSQSNKIKDVKNNATSYVAMKSTTVTAFCKPSNSVPPVKLPDDNQNDYAGEGIDSPPTSLETTNLSSSHATISALDNNARPGGKVNESESLLTEHGIEREDSVALNRYVRLGLSIAEREAIGRAAKHLINHGRLLHLRQLGLTAKLVYYVDREVTLENVAIVAHS